jgi:hypothetical protein
MRAPEILPDSTEMTNHRGNKMLDTEPQVIDQSQGSETVRHAQLKYRSHQPVSPWSLNTKDTSYKCLINDYMYIIATQDPLTQEETASQISV